MVSFVVRRFLGRTHSGIAIGLGERTSERLEVRRQRPGIGRSTHGEVGGARPASTRSRRRHSAQRPENIYTSRWRYSLMNWGHDPAKD